MILMIILNLEYVENLAKSNTFSRSLTCQTYKEFTVYIYIVE